MKRIHNPLILLAGAIALAPSLLRATDDFAMGDLALVFYSQPTSADPIGTEYYVFNLGPAAGFRANTLNNVPVKNVNGVIASSNIKADLDAVFTTSWPNSGNVRMMVISTITQLTPTISVDPARTVYFSSARTSLDINQKGFDPNTTYPYYEGTGGLTLGSGFRIQSSNDISAFVYEATNGQIVGPPPATSGANTSGVRLTTTYANNISTGYLPPSVGTYFKVGNDPSAVLGPGTLPGTANVEAAVDVFRMIHTLTGAELTSGSSSNNAALGKGQFIGSITLNTAGDLKVQAVGIPPASGNFASWATTNGVTGGQSGDSDNDGVLNSIEYALTTNLTGSDGSPGTFTGGTLSFTKRSEAVTNGDVTYQIEESTDLGVTDPWTTVTPTSNTPTAITYALLPPGPARKFARLKITIAP